MSGEITIEDYDEVDHELLEIFVSTFYVKFYCSNADLERVKFIMEILDSYC